MSKNTDNVLLVPGESGWEIWTGQDAASLSLRTATATVPAGELVDLPPGDILLLFPVKSVTAVPMRVASDDEALFSDLAALHAERLGLRPDPMAGQLTDVFVIAREAENTALLSVMLRAPEDGDLPPRGPKTFDISPRAFPLGGDSLALWKEFGRWVFSLFHQGNLVYCQATSVTSTSPDEALVREIRLSLLQLGMQGLEIEPQEIHIWTSESDVHGEAFSRGFRGRVTVAARPVPVIPSPLSKLLPADVRAARRAARRRQNFMLGIAAIGLLYLGVLGWFGYGLWKDSTATKMLNQQASAAGPEATEYSEHVAKWDALADAIDIERSPVELLSRIAGAIPPNSGLRLRTAEIDANSIKLLGEAPQLQAVNQFSLNLTRKNGPLARFDWQTPESNQSTRGWEFVYSAQTPVATVP